MLAASTCALPTPTGESLAVVPVTALADGRPVVDASAIGGGSAIVVDHALVAVTPEDIGRRAVVAGLGTGARPAVLLGLVHEPNATSAPDRVELRASREIILRCGQAELRLTSDGTVRIRGANILSHAHGTQRIRGGNVQIN
ncbi:MAG: hypothetical protein MUE41_01430 [Gemmatimonadaceae bacterium]|nr:hypothetical protein [Gemmatimonadaceae bacterium]